MRPLAKFGPIVYFLSFLLLTLATPLFANQASKEQVISRYEQAVKLVEELDVYHEDVFDVLPKVRLASRALLRDDIKQADLLVTEALEDLYLLQSKRTRRLLDREKLAWLRVYVDIFQKLALLALIAFFLVKFRFFNRMLVQGRLDRPAQFFLALLVAIVSILFSVFEISKYGESAWAFFDPQLVLIAAGGLLGGPLTGCLAGLMVGGFRWALNSEFSVYLILTLASGIIGGILSRKLTDFKATQKIAFVTGALVGLVHAAFTYTSMWDLVAWPKLLLAVLLLAFLEGLGVFVFMGIVSNVLREQNRTQIRHDLLNTKLLFLQAQMQPHFIFNTLNTISSICGTEKAKKAQGLVLRLADFIRTTLKRRESMVTLKEEIQLIDNYLEIEKARFQSRLNIKKDIQISDAVWETSIPILILQPLVENAVRHGIGKKESGGLIELVIREADGALQIQVQDDGVGMDQKTIARQLKNQDTSSEGLGIGVQNINERLKRLYGEASGLHYESKMGEGTKVSLQIPLSKETSDDD